MEIINIILIVLISIIVLTVLSITLLTVCFIKTDNKIIKEKGNSIMWYARKRTLLFALPLSFTKYTLLDDKLLLNSGFFNTVEDEIRLYRILDLTLTRTIWQRILGLGTIVCKTSDKSVPLLQIQNIKDSSNIKEMLSNQVEKERIAKRVTSREYMSSDNFDDDNDEISEN